MNAKKKLDFPLATMAAALFAAYGSAWAQEVDEIAELAKPSSSIAVGMGYLSKDAPRFGIYSGLTDEGAYGLLDVDIVKRDDATGTWLKFNGRNLGLESRDLRISHERQGAWAYYLDYSETPRFEPRTVRTAVLGIGTPNLTIQPPATPISEVRLKMKREATGLGFSKQLGGGFDVNVRVRNEEKNGARLFGRGTSGTMEFAPEPINSTTQQLDATIGYTGERLHLTGGYYGSSYDNHNTALNIAGGLIANHSLIALPPDNEAHQLHLGGGYKFSPTTKGTFKLAYARAIQNSKFITPASATPPTAGTDLDGKVDTTRVQVGLTTRPTQNLSVLANANFDDRDDRTKIRSFSIATINAGNSFNGTNEPRSVRTTSGKLEASYRMPMEFRLTGGFDYVEKERSSYPLRSTAARDKTEEASWRMVLQRAMSETVSGSIEFAQSDRHGTPYLWTTETSENTPAGATVTPTRLRAVQAITPLHLMDRQRDKLKLSVSWTPVEEFSLQFAADASRDDYGQRTAAEMGLREGKANNYSIDASYALSDEWQATAWVSKNETRLEQAGGEVTAAPASSTTANSWFAALRNNGKAIGFGLRGKPQDRLQLGVDLSYSDIADEFRMRRLTTGAAIAMAPTDFYTRQGSLKLFGTYAIEKYASIRLDYIFDRYSSNDWTWSTMANPNAWTYSDGTQVGQRPRQNVNFVGITYIYRFY